jgi:hypothetical protein
MQVEDGLDVPEAVVGEGCDLRHGRLGKLAGKCGKLAGLGQIKGITQMESVRWLTMMEFSLRLIRFRQNSLSVGAGEGRALAPRGCRRRLGKSRSKPVRNVTRMGAG